MQIKSNNTDLWVFYAIRTQKTALPTFHLRGCPIGILGIILRYFLVDLDLIDKELARKTCRVRAEV